MSAGMTFLLFDGMTLVFFSCKCQDFMCYLSSHLNVQTVNVFQFWNVHSLAISVFIGLHLSLHKSLKSHKKLVIEAVWSMETSYTSNAHQPLPM